MRRPRSPELRKYPVGLGTLRSRERWGELVRRRVVPIPMLADGQRFASGCGRSARQPKVATRSRSPAARRATLTSAVTTGSLPSGRPISGGCGRYQRPVSPAPTVDITVRRRPGTSPRCTWHGGRAILGLGRGAWWFGDRRGWPPPGHPAVVRPRQNCAAVMKLWRRLCGLMRLVIPARRARRLTVRSAA